MALFEDGSSKARMGGIVTKRFAIEKNVQTGFQLPTGGKGFKVVTTKTYQVVDTVTREVLHAYPTLIQAKKRLNQMNERERP